MKKSEILKPLKIVKRALARDDVVPIFKCLMFDGGRVSAYNDRIGISVPCKMPDAFGVNGRTFMGILESMSDDIKISILPESVQLKAGKSDFNMPYFGPEDFIFERPTIENGVTYTLPSVMPLQSCLTTASNDASQAAIAGVTFVPGYMYSCDGDTLTRAKLDGAASEPTQVTVPSEFCEVVISTYNDVGHTGPIEIKTGGGWAATEIGECEIFGRLLDVTNPVDFGDLVEKSLPEGWAGLLKQVPEGFDDALYRAIILTSTETSPTTLTADGSQVTFKTKNFLGEITDTVKFDHKPVDATVSPVAIQPPLQKCSQFAITERCCIFVKDKELLIIVGNLEGND